ncbi:MAG: LysM peptidoglycan-binding domain-containing protein [Bacteroidales bacterium]|nr:LysM peptidoglycan-binding domain-containing protein [Bacteroidales bacterium]MDY6000944.1 LysM peptidoglycan-binding domain-containing protein [Candidatus Cryptobacteroides sp.]
MFKKLQGIIFIIFLMAAASPNAQGVSKKYIDSLKVTLRSMDMPPAFLFLPHALSEVRGRTDRAGIWSLTAADAIRGARKLGIRLQVPNDTTVINYDIRSDASLSTKIALGRLSELFNEYGDWDSAVIAFATSPAAFASMDSAQVADAPILRYLKEDEARYSKKPAKAFDDIERQLEMRQAELEAARHLEADKNKARVDSLRKQQARAEEKTVYRIKRGDTLGGIAARYHVKVSEIKKWNNLRSDMIREGKTLIIYRK